MSRLLLYQREGQIEAYIVPIFVEELLHLRSYYQDYVWNIRVYFVHLVDIFLSVGVILFKVMLKLCLLLIEYEFFIDFCEILWQQSINIAFLIELIE